MNTENPLKVSDIMTANVMTVRMDDMLYDAIREMEIATLSALPVVDANGKVCGILSNSDLLSLSYNLHCDVSTLSFVPETVRKTLVDVLTDDNCDVRVSSVMNSEVETIGSGESIIQAAEALVLNAVHHLPVVDAANRPIGIVSAMDIVRAVAFGNS